jgi:phospholipid/cholesterol/gamma-HCH transport system substrate-binding protein
LVAFAAVLVAILSLGNVQLFSRSHRYHADFSNVEALPPKAAVKVAGVEIGKVRSVSLVEGKARVTIDINPDVKIHADAKAKVESTGIIGTKFVNLFPGSEPAPVLDPGSAIEGVEAVGLNQMLEKIGTLFDPDPKHGNSVDNLKETIANIRNVSRALNVAMGQHAAEMEEIVLNIRDLTASIKVVAAHVEEITTENKEDVKVAIEKFRSVSERMDALLAKVQRGEGTVGALMTDEKTEQNVKEAVASIKDTATSAKKVLGRLTSMNVYWDYRFRYDHRDQESRSDLAVKMVPQPGKFYAFGVTNLGEVPSGEKHTKYERKNRVTAVLGHDLGPFTGYIGAVESRGGGGLNFRPLFFSSKWNRRFEVGVQASDFSRDRTVNGQRFEKALVDAGAHVAVTKWLWLGVRARDVLERSAFQSYLNIIFRDEDLAYLFGFASLSR